MKVKQKDCKAQTVQISGIDVGILDLENKIAYLLDADTFTQIITEKLNAGGGILPYDEVVGYAHLTQNLRQRGFAINCYRPKLTEETRRVYDVLERLEN